jgi:hypothetical protein
MDNLITFLKNYKYFKNYLFKELNRMTAERLLGKELRDYVIKHDLINSKPNEDLLEKYKKICDRTKNG